MSAHFLRIIGDALNHFPLYSGLFTIGSSEDADIVLPCGDSFAKIVYVDGQVLLQAAKAIYIDGKKVETFPHELAPGQVITLGDNHLFYGEQEALEPPLPTIAQDTPTKETKKMTNLQQLAIYFVASGALAVFLVCVVALVMDKFYVKHEPAKIAQMERARPDLEFIQSILGDKLLSAKLDNGTWQVRALKNVATASQAADLIGAGNIEVVWVDADELLFHVKQALTSITSSKNVKLSVNSPTHFTLTGALLAKDAATIEGVIASARSNNPDAQIDSKITVVSPSFSIVSVAISNHSAQATLRQGNHTITVPENGRVFDIGTLKIISPTGLLIATPGGDVFIPWRQS